MGRMKIFESLRDFEVIKPCLKQSVKAAILTLNGELIFGSNKIANDVKACPRVEQGSKTGEGYELCKSICNQGAHAEVNAIEKALKLNKTIADSTLYLFNHYYCCDSCVNSMKDVGISKAIIFDNNGSIVKEYDFKK